MIKYKYNICRLSSQDARVRDVSQLQPAGTLKSLPVAIVLGAIMPCSRLHCLGG